MPIFQIHADGLRPLSETKFEAEGLTERRDIQTLLRDQIAVLGEKLLVISEEFAGWLDSSRRIDLLCIDTSANLVVVELKRTDDGGHMELQALRYAAMISEMTFDQLINTFASYKSKVPPDVDEAKKEILDFLGWDDVNESQFAQETRIILAAADFRKEITTTVIWLRENYGLDIKCVRMKPYRMLDGTVLIDMQQLIPLPEATEFQTQIGVKKLAEKQNRSERTDHILRFWKGLLDYAKSKTALHANCSPTKDNWIVGSSGQAGFQLIYTIRETDAQVALWIAFGAGLTKRNKGAFKALEQQKQAIESDFGEPLDWQELPNRDGCRIRNVVPGGYRSPPEQWPEIFQKLVDAMIRLDRTMRSRLKNLSYNAEV